MNQSHDPLAHYTELSWRGMVLGALITVIFTASNVYLGLKVGLTFASSIPAAVISMAVLKFFTGSNILENNMVQTQASAAGTLSSVIFVLPAMLLVGYWQDFPFFQTMLICCTGGLLGVIFTIPLRRAMVVNSDLPYPEGVAAAEILKVGQASDGQETGAKEIALGGAVAGVIGFCTKGLRLLAESAGYWFKLGGAIFQFPMGFSLALLGAGYLVGIVGGLAMLFGLLLTWFGLVPYFSLGANGEGDLAAIATELWRTKARFVGVGVIGIAAIWTLLTLLKPAWQGLRESLGGISRGGVGRREDQDLSPKAMLAVFTVATVLIAATLGYFVGESPLASGSTIILGLTCTVLAVLIGFFVAAASGYMAGLVGSSSSPISGLSIIAIVIISLTLLTLGRSLGLLEQPDGQKFLTALTIFTGSIVISIAAISNDNLQDLKTGFLVRATPWRQQVALLIGCLVGSLVISPVLEMLYHAYGFADALPRPDMDKGQVLSAPQATLMKVIATGIFSSELEWRYIGAGVAIGIAVIIVNGLLRQRSGGRLGLPPLAVGMGIYLPPAINMPIVFGALLAWGVGRWLKHKYAQLPAAQREQQLARAEHQGTLFSAGLIVGESLIGVLMAFIITASLATGGSNAPLALKLENWDRAGEWLGLLAFALAMLILAWRILRRPRG